jgi:signal peptidase I
VGYKYKLLYIGLWGFIATFICFHAYIVTPIRREKSKKTILIVCAVFFCLSLLSYNQLLVRKYVVEAFRIPTPTPFNWIPPEQQWGSSMEPTLVHEDRFLVRKNKKYMLKRGDVVVFKSPDDPNIPFTMRIAALSGEKIRIKNGILYIDMQKVNWRTIEFNEYSKYKYGINEPYKVPENCFFVLGDNSENSRDSRIYGAIPLSDLIGKAYKIYWPLSRRGPIE